MSINVNLANPESHFSQAPLKAALLALGEAPGADNEHALISEVDFLLERLPLAEDTAHRLLNLAQALRFSKHYLSIEKAANAFLALGFFDEALVTVDQAVKKDPTNKLLRVQHSYFLGFAGRFVEAQKILAELDKEFPNDPLIQFHSGWYSIFNGNVVSGFKQILKGRELWPWGRYAQNLPRPWDGYSPLPAHQPLFVLCEGGAGDMILTLSLVQSLQKRVGHPIIVVVSDSLKQLAESVGSGVVRVVGESEISLPSHMTWVAGLELGKIVSESSFPTGPFLRPPAKIDQEWRNRLSLLRRRFNKIVALRNHGSSGHQLEIYRRIDQVEFRERLIKHFPQIAFVWVNASSDQAEIGSRLENEFCLSHYLSSWAETAGLLTHVDQTISTCTSIAHLAAAVGSKTVVLSPTWSYHSWAQPTEKSYWYGDHVRVLCSERPRVWNNVWPHLIAELEKLNG